MDEFRNKRDLLIKIIVKVSVLLTIQENKSDPLSMWHFWNSQKIYIRKPTKPIWPASRNANVTTICSANNLQRRRRWRLMMTGKENLQ